MHALNSSMHAIWRVIDFNSSSSSVCELRKFDDNSKRCFMSKFFSFIMFWNINANSVTWSSVKSSSNPLRWRNFRNFIRECAIFLKWMLCLLSCSTTLTSSWWKTASVCWFSVKRLSAKRLSVGWFSVGLNSVKHWKLKIENWN